MTLVSDAPHLQCAAVNKMCSRISSDTGRVSVRKHFHFTAQYFTQHYVATFYFTVIHIVFWGIAARFAPAAWMPESDGARIWAFKQEQDKRSFNLCTAVRELRGHWLLRSGAYESAISANHQRLPHILTVKIHSVLQEMFLLQFRHFHFWELFHRTVQYVEHHNMLNIFIARRDASGAEKLILTAIAL